MLPTPNIVGERLFLLGSSSLVGDLIAFLPVIDESYVALLGELDALFIRITIEAPEESANAIRPAVIEAVGPSLLADVLNIQIGRSAKSLNHLVENYLSLAGVLLIDGDPL